MGIKERLMGNMLADAFKKSEKTINLMNDNMKVLIDNMKTIQHNQVETEDYFKKLIKNQEKILGKLK